MTIEVQVNKSYEATARCDQCGAVQTWEQAHEFSHDFESGHGLMMLASVGSYGRPSGLLWFDVAECLRAWVEANVIGPQLLAAEG